MIAVVDFAGIAVVIGAIGVFISTTVGAVISFRASKVAADKLNQVVGVVDGIHTLVNSDLTASKQQAVDDKRIQLAMTEELISMRSAQGEEPSPATLAACDLIRTRIAEMQVELDGRYRATATAEKQIEDKR